MKDVECPYCGKEQEINHDDGYGYNESETFEQECSACDKIFTFTTSVSFYYDVKKVPCKNGDGEHRWIDKVGCPKEAFIGRQYCDVCDEERDIDPEGRRIAMKNYYNKLRGKPEVCGASHV